MRVEDKSSNMDHNRIIVFHFVMYDMVWTKSKQNKML